jgi:PHD-finger
MDALRETELLRFEEELRVDQFGTAGGVLGDNAQLASELAGIEKPAKPPLSAFHLWSNEVGRSRLDPDIYKRTAATGAGIGSVSKLLAEMWHEFRIANPREADEFQKRVKVMRQEYSRDLEEYKEKIARAQEAMLSDHMNAMRSIVSMVQDEEEREAQADMQRKDEQRREKQRLRAERDAQRRAVESAKHPRCTVCDKRSRKAQRLSCNACQRHFHFSCIGITKPRWEYLKGFPDWTCAECAKCVRCEADPEKNVSYAARDFKFMMPCDVCRAGWHCSCIEVTTGVNHIGVICVCVFFLPLFVSFFLPLFLSFFYSPETFL